MSKHTNGPTPGPWEVEEDLPNAITIHPIGFVRPFIEVLTLVNEIQEAKANAHLIAAAPELFEALQGMIELWKIDFETLGGDPSKAKNISSVPQLQNAFTAIAKAEGK